MAHLMENFNQYLKKSQAIIFKKGNFKNKLNPLKLFRNPIPCFTHTEKKRPPGVGSLNAGSPLSRQRNSSAAYPSPQGFSPQPN
ncbi:hypothetical protein TNCV_3131931 [Trichonephila clavipes]|uniref:Uncharacterized protein n=1 Tax=Trichonephila clavipes TaxID=2585209 RepID=A0A8X6S2K8_TRICX|nr:hypothetical protein TNCV_3131931 [Trichonephila clavipes]